MTDRFDLEQNIMKCWNVTDDIDLLYSTLMEKEMTTDDIANFLLGMKTMYDLKFDELFTNFEKMVSEKKIV